MKVICFVVYTILMVSLRTGKLFLVLPTSLDAKDIFFIFIHITEAKMKFTKRTYLYCLRFHLFGFH